MNAKASYRTGTAGTIKTKGRNISKVYNIRGDIMHGQIRLRLIRDGAAVAVYSAMHTLDGVPHLISGTPEQLRDACDRIKAEYGLIEVQA